MTTFFFLFIKINHQCSKIRISVEPTDGRQQSCLTEVNLELQQDDIKRSSNYGKHEGEKDENEMEEEKEPVRILESLSSRSVCRICHTNSWAKEPLVSPCRLAGRLQFKIAIYFLEAKILMNLI